MRQGCARSDAGHRRCGCQSSPKGCRNATTTNELGTASIEIETQAATGSRAKRLCDKDERGGGFETPRRKEIGARVPSSAQSAQKGLKSRRLELVQTAMPICHEHNLARAQARNCGFGI